MLVGLVVMATGCVTYAGELGSTTFPERLGPPPAILGLEAESVTIQVPARESVAGWYVAGPPHEPTIVMLHGHTDTRRQMLTRAALVLEDGYGVLLIDLPGHGESRADAVEFGWTERFAASAAVDWVRRQRPRTKVGVMGFSLGAATAALAGPYLEADALVLEGAFATFEDTVRNRARRLLGPLSGPAEFALIGQVQIQLGVPPDSLRPVVSLARTSAPTFVIGGLEDRMTPPAETRALFEAAPEPKELWLVEDAGHEDFFALEPETYRRRVLGFLNAHLR